MGWLRFITQPPNTPGTVAPVAKNQTLGVHYDTAWARRTPAKILRRIGVISLMKPAISLYGSPKVIGSDRLIDVEGPVIFAANHHSHADTTLLLATIPPHLGKNLVVAAGADYFFPNRFAAAASALFIGAIPIERQKLSKLSIRNVEKAVDSGHNLLIFPEGGRSPDGWSKPHRPGAAFVAKRTGAPIVPTYIDGTENILPKGKNWPSRSQCAVVFGEPMRPKEGEDARDFAARIEHRINELADEFASGWWEAKKRAHSNKTPALAGPEVGAWRRRWALGPKPGQRRSSPATPKSWPNL